MSSWSDVLRPQLVDLGAYVPGPSLDDLKRKVGIEDVAKLNWNEGLFGPLPGVLDAVALELPETWSYPEHAYLDLREAVAAEIGARPDQILPGHGIQTLILALCSAFLSPGDRVVIPQPTYGLYAQASRAAGATVERVPSPELRLDLERIADAARRAEAKLAWVCDPNNPTGSLVTPGEWDAFLAALPGRCAVVVDEAYVDYAAPERRPVRERDVEAGAPVIVLRTFSKIFGLAGLRLGYALVHETLEPYLDVVQEPFNVNRAACAAGVASLRRAALVGERREQARAARLLLAGLLADAGMRSLPSEANFVLVHVGVDDLALADLLARRGILVRPASDFGLEGYVRVTVGPEPLMERAAAELARARKELLAEKAVG
jgi:histidinol-phosphate aminotransferase